MTIPETIIEGNYRGVGRHFIFSNHTDICWGHSPKVTHKPIKEIHTIDQILLLSDTQLYMIHFSKKYSSVKLFELLCHKIIIKLYNWTIWLLQQVKNTISVYEVLLLHYIHSECSTAQNNVCSEGNNLCFTEVVGTLRCCYSVGTPSAYLKENTGYYDFKFSYWVISGLYLRYSSVIFINVSWPCYC